MNLHQTETIGKESFPICEFVLSDTTKNGQNNAPAKSKKNSKQSKHTKQPLAIPSDASNNDDLEDIILPLNDRTGRASLNKIKQGNIMIAGYNADLIGQLSARIYTACLNQKQTITIIDAKEFAEIIQDKNIEITEAQNLKLLKHNNSHRLLIQANLNHIEAETLEQIYQFCKTGFIFSVTGLRIQCAHDGVVTNSTKVNPIIEALKGELPLRRYLLASLDNEEFLMIRGYQECIRKMR